MYQDLQEHLKNRRTLLHGAWIKENNSYEGDLCKLLEFTQEKNRYWDAAWGNYRIELKKGASIWLDLVRYSEMLLKINEQAKTDTISLFFFPNKSKDAISTVACVSTPKIIEILCLDGNTASFLIALNKRLPRQLNAQASLTPSDIKRIAAFTVPQVVSLDDLL